MKEAVKETFKHREIGFNDIFAFTEGFITSEIHQNRWKAFLKMKKTLVNAELNDMVSRLRILLLSIVDSIMMIWNILQSGNINPKYGNRCEGCPESGESG